MKLSDVTDEQRAWGAIEDAARKADIAEMKAGTITQQEAVDRAEERRMTAKIRMSWSQATTFVRSAQIHAHCQCMNALSQTSK